MLPQFLGLVGLLFMLVFWAFTQRTEPALLTAFGGLLAVGQGAEAVVALRRPLPAPNSEEDR